MLSGPTEKKKVAFMPWDFRSLQSAGTPSFVPLKVSTSIHSPTTGILSPFRKITANVFSYGIKTVCVLVNAKNGFAIYARPVRHSFEATAEGCKLPSVDYFFRLSFRKKLRVSSTDLSRGIWGLHFTNFAAFAIFGFLNWTS